MVKLFGWEKKMEKIAEKREEELLLQWKRQVFELIGAHIKLVSFQRTPCLWLILFSSVIPVFVMVATYFT